ncbi:hypothetical protein TNCT_400721 [Trichonephila clavata]|uniref:Uncharacterized protein n=1 Tax=Trichonephila clavata TaxID=2740835 RepID=A0A8X6J6U4_TRICU|nr:hypothetical protein TNCT_400721 [Trichonephila clavata]
MTFLRHEVEGAEHRVLAKNVFGSSTNGKESDEQVQRDEPTSTTLVVKKYARKISCIFCDQSRIVKKYQRKVTKTENQRLCVKYAALFALNLAILQKSATVV